MADPALIQIKPMHHQCESSLELTTWQFEPKASRTHLSMQAVFRASSTSTRVDTPPNAVVWMNWDGISCMILYLARDIIQP